MTVRAKRRTEPPDYAFPSVTVCKDSTNSTLKLLIEIRYISVVDQKHLESFEMWCWRRKEKISLTDHVRNKDVLFRVRSRGISYMK
jgi:hypothetical protein